MTIKHAAFAAIVPAMVLTMVAGEVQTPASALQVKWMRVKIQWFKPGEIPRNPRTGKLKSVVDERFCH